MPTPASHSIELPAPLLYLSSGQVWRMEQDGQSSAALLRCETASGRCISLGQDVPARTAFYYAFPHLAAPDRLYVFMGLSPSLLQPPETFQLYQQRPDGYGVSALRSDQHAVQEALWAADGSGAVISAAEGQARKLLWLAAANTPAIPLPVESAAHLRWGRPVK